MASATTASSSSAGAGAGESDGGLASRQDALLLSLMGGLLTIVHAGLAAFGVYLAGDAFMGEVRRSVTVRAAWKVFKDGMDPILLGCGCRALVGFAYVDQKGSVSTSENKYQNDMPLGPGSVSQLNPTLFPPESRSLSPPRSGESGRMHEHRTHQLGFSPVGSRPGSSSR